MSAGKRSTLERFVDALVMVIFTAVVMAGLAGWALVISGNMC